MLMLLLANICERMLCTYLILFYWPLLQQTRSPHSVPLLWFYQGHATGFQFIGWIIKPLPSLIIKPSIMLHTFSSFHANLEATRQCPKRERPWSYQWEEPQNPHCNVTWIRNHFVCVLSHWELLSFLSQKWTLTIKFQHWDALEFETIQCSVIQNVIIPWKMPGTLLNQRSLWDFGVDLLSQ